MRVMVCGETGFIGRHVQQALQARGHEVIGLRSGSGQAARHLDMRTACQAQAWLPLLQGVDAVVNAVGVLRDSPQHPMEAIHHRAPAALFEACAAQGVKRVIQVSALGMDNMPGAYAQSKLAAERALQQVAQGHGLTAHILRPSVVWGPGGASTRLLTTLARLPMLALPRAARRCQIQPVLAQDLAEAVAASLAGPLQAGCSTLAVVGPQAFTMQAWIARVRQGLGHAPAQVITLPDWLTNGSARLGDACPITPWGRNTLALMSRDNVADAAALTTLLGRPPRLPDPS